MSNTSVLGGHRRDVTTRAVASGFCDAANGMMMRGGASCERMRVRAIRKEQFDSLNNRLERVISFSTLSAMIYGRPLPLRDLVNFLDGTKSLSK
jgi:hypothetical protein